MYEVLNLGTQQFNGVSSWSDFNLSVIINLDLIFNHSLEYVVIK